MLRTFCPANSRFCLRASRKFLRQVTNGHYRPAALAGAQTPQGVHLSIKTRMSTIQSASASFSPTDLSTLFEDWDLSRKYVTHRHSYSEELFRIISDYCKQAGNDLDLAIDIGCGPGNSTVGFSEHFKQVLGIDSSKTQIAFAPRHIPNCQFEVSLAHRLPFVHSGSADLVCSGMAFHLMSQQQTLAEIDRILKPGGTFAIFGHGPPRSSDKRMDLFVKQVISYLRPRVLNKYSHIFSCFKHIEHPYAGSNRTDSIVVTHNMSLDGVLSVYELMQRVLQYSEQGDPDRTFMDYVHQRVTEIFPDIGQRTSEPSFEFHFNIILMMGRKPLQ